MTQMSDRNWEKRLSGEPNALMMGFVESLSFDQRLYPYDIAGSLAHARMLQAQGLLTESEYQVIEGGLAGIEADIRGGLFVFDTRFEDIHMAIEHALIDRVGEPGKKLHTGRSRNDQVATDLRLWMRDQIDTLVGKVTEVQRALVAQAAKYPQDIMPAYTHFQRAQPVVIGAYLLSLAEPLERDRQRLMEARNRVNVCPLGSGAIAGSTLPLDRERTRDDLRFAGLCQNSIDGVSDRDFCAEFLFACTLISLHLSKLAEDWIVYASSEFGFIQIDDAFCTSSSMMPQKRNPDALELLRGKSGGVVGALMAMLTLLKAQPSGYNRDLQEDKLHVFRASDSIEACLDVAAALIAHTHFRTDHIHRGIDQGFLDATVLAEYLVTKGIPFRQAHGVVGSLVSWCEAEGLQLQQASLEQLQAHCDRIKEDVYETLGAQNVAQRYATTGAGGIRQLQEQLALWHRRLASK
jgi:argininosuccinate lyase